MRCISQAVGVVVVFVATSAFAVTTYTETVNGIKWTYTVENGYASVGGGSSSSPAVPTTTAGAVSIPSSLGGYSVVSIGSYAFSGCKMLTNVTIPESVTSIRYCAFSMCSGLKGVTISNGVTSIGSLAFNMCSGLTSVAIPAAVTYIAGDTFDGCSGCIAFQVAENNQQYKAVNCSYGQQACAGGGNRPSSRKNGARIPPFPYRAFDPRALRRCTWDRSFSKAR